MKPVFADSSRRKSNYDDTRAALPLFSSSANSSQKYTPALNKLLTVLIIVSAVFFSIAVAFSLPLWFQYRERNVLGRVKQDTLDEILRMHQLFQGVSVATTFACQTGTDATTIRQDALKMLSDNRDTFRLEICSEEVTDVTGCAMQFANEVAQYSSSAESKFRSGIQNKVDSIDYMDRLLNAYSTDSDSFCDFVVTENGAFHAFTTDRTYISGLRDVEDALNAADPSSSAQNLPWIMLAFIVCVAPLMLLPLLGLSGVIERMFAVSWEEGEKLDRAVKKRVDHVALGTETIFTDRLIPRLQVLSGLATLLHASAETAEQRKLLRVVEQNVFGCHEALRHCLRFMEWELWLDSEKPCTLSLRDHLEIVVRSLWGDALERKCLIAVDYGPRVPSTVCARPNRFRSLLFQILKGVIDVSEDRLITVHVSVKHVMPHKFAVHEFSAVPDDMKVYRIQVTVETGEIGIEENLARALSPALGLLQGFIGDDRRKKRRSTIHSLLGGGRQKGRKSSVTAVRLAGGACEVRSEGTDSETVVETTLELPGRFDITDLNSVLSRFAAGHMKLLPTQTPHVFAVLAVGLNDSSMAVFDSLAINLPLLRIEDLDSRDQLLHAIAAFPNPNGPSRGNEGTGKTRGTPILVIIDETELWSAPEGPLDFCESVWAINESLLIASISQTLTNNWEKPEGAPVFGKRFNQEARRRCPPLHRAGENLFPSVRQNDFEATKLNGLSRFTTAREPLTTRDTCALLAKGWAEAEGAKQQATQNNPSPVRIRMPTRNNELQEMDTFSPSWGVRRASAAFGSITSGVHPDEIAAAAAASQRNPSRRAVRSPMHSGGRSRRSMNPFSRRRNFEESAAVVSFVDRLRHVTPGEEAVMDLTRRYVRDSKMTHPSEGFKDPELTSLFKGIRHVPTHLKAPTSCVIGVLNEAKGSFDGGTLFRRFAERAQQFSWVACKNDARDVILTQRHVHREGLADGFSPMSPVLRTRVSKQETPTGTGGPFALPTPAPAASQSPSEVELAAALAVNTVVNLTDILDDAPATGGAEDAAAAAPPQLGGAQRDGTVGPVSGGKTCEPLHASEETLQSLDEVFLPRAVLGSVMLMSSPSCVNRPSLTSREWSSITLKARDRRVVEEKIMGHGKNRHPLLSWELDVLLLNEDDAIIAVLGVMLQDPELGGIIEMDKRAALVVAALCHDLGHPGVNNGFLSNTQTFIAQTYNDTAVLESMHAALACMVLDDDRCDIFECAGARKKELKQVIVNAILKTDMTLHGGMTAKLKTLKEGSDREQADIANPLMDRRPYVDWAERVCAEFLYQNLMEQELGLPPSMPVVKNLGLRCLAPAQTGFIDFVCTPFFSSLAKALPTLAPRMDTMAANSFFKEKLEALESAGTPSMNPPIFDVLAAVAEEEERNCASPAGAERRRVPRSGTSATVMTEGKRPAAAREAPNSGGGPSLFRRKAGKEKEKNKEQQADNLSPSGADASRDVEVSGVTVTGQVEAEPDHQAVAATLSPKKKPQQQGGGAMERKGWGGEPHPPNSSQRGGGNSPS
uniref:Phosphodiesterase n=1 Tax=Chromera velia CCMP2878 TaxID=1169474 RepID=A0A0G4I9V4_9ALVE|eukprot:Cvel_12358.t1-p1 / transcript=Cvel_12358.t1 / gene=Cvel_12358 / organism=Chromera_velia_CCMP2878 / gene_product=cAMP-specific 3',5'-cyclic phosphodiesterase 4A, putative / transcript_product=cAMP-specific 3',5'-cyclic phosphodiesterase 4A, putative / location=Cvel_scaffold804:47178-58791(+) / protein_length=1539 / sequence_SO=supercontig / SO=protein_coding / is_pseudo=false